MNINEAIVEVDETNATRAGYATHITRVTYIADTLFREWCDDYYEPLLDSPKCTIEAARVAYSTLYELHHQTYEALCTDYGRPHTAALRRLQDECRRLVAAMPAELQRLRNIHHLVEEVIEALDERADDGGSW